MHSLKIIVTSTRPGRKGLAIGRWVEEVAKTLPQFQCELLDLAEINLPFMDEPNHPSMRQYTKDHTKAWSRKIDGADAFVIIAAEYNHGFTAPFKNAVDYLFQEWNHKPVSFVGYGGIAGGARSIQMMKPVFSFLNMVSVNESVFLPMVAQLFEADGTFHPKPEHEKAARTMLESVDKWAGVLKPMRSR